MMNMLFENASITKMEWNNYFETAMEMCKIDSAYFTEADEGKKENPIMKLIRKVTEFIRTKIAAWRKKWQARKIKNLVDDFGEEAFYEDVDDDFFNFIDDTEEEARSEAAKHEEEINELKTKLNMPGANSAFIKSELEKSQKAVTDLSSQLAELKKKNLTLSAAAEKVNEMTKANEENVKKIDALSKNLERLRDRENEYVIHDKKVEALSKNLERARESQSQMISKKRDEERALYTMISNYQSVGKYTDITLNAFFDALKTKFGGSRGVNQDEYDDEAKEVEDTLDKVSDYKSSKQSSDINKKWRDDINAETHGAKSHDGKLKQYYNGPNSYTHEKRTDGNSWSNSATDKEIAASKLRAERDMKKSRENENFKKHVKLDKNGNLIQQNEITDKVEKERDNESKKQYEKAKRERGIMQHAAKQKAREITK